MEGKDTSTEQHGKKATQKRQARVPHRIFQHSVDGLVELLDPSGWSGGLRLEEVCYACGGAVPVFSNKKWKGLGPNDLKEIIKEDRLALILYPETKDYHCLSSEDKMTRARERVERAVDHLDLDRNLEFTHAFRTGVRDDATGRNALPRLIEVARIYFVASIFAERETPLSLADFLDHPTFMTELLSILLIGKQCVMDVRLLLVLEDARVRLREMEQGSAGRKVFWKVLVFDAICSGEIGDWLLVEDRLWTRARAVAALLLKLIGIEHYEPERPYSHLVPLLVSIDEVRQQLDGRDALWYSCRSDTLGEATIALIDKEMKCMLCELGSGLTGLVTTEPDPLVKKFKEFGNETVASPHFGKNLKERFIIIRAKERSTRRDS